MSVFDLYSIGIGPSSSHTIGPMRAAKYFLEKTTNLNQATSLKIELRGSLAFTGLGHGTNLALLAGLEGHEAKSIDPIYIKTIKDKVSKNKALNLLNQHVIKFDAEKDIVLNYKDISNYHPNAMIFILYNQDQIINRLELYSIGGGYVHDLNGDINKSKKSKPIPYPFNSMAELSLLCKNNKLSIADLIRINESSTLTKTEINKQLDLLINQMFASIKSGLKNSGILPGGLNLKRRAAQMQDQLLKKELFSEITHKNALSLEWLNCFAIAVNEENAVGNRVVTSPTNGAAGVIPAVLYYLKSFYPDITQKILQDFLLTAGAIGSLYKKNASISAAEVGCQGEIGVASSMAAGALTSALSDSLEQIENAAEIAMEHHLGLTCDPIAGLVQIPCIERNAMGAAKAVNASKIALLESGKNRVNLDQVIATMLQTGKEMNSIFKETSLGGLAANVQNC